MEERKRCLADRNNLMYPTGTVKTAKLYPQISLPSSPAVESFLYVHRRPQTVVMPLRTQNQKTHLIRAHLRHSRQRTGELTKLKCGFRPVSYTEYIIFKSIFLMIVMNPECSSSLCGRAPSIPEGHDLSRSSSNASSFASVVEENETEATEDYDTGMVTIRACVCVSVCVCVLSSLLLLSVPLFSRRVSRQQGHHTSGTHSLTAPGWRTA